MSGATFLHFVGNRFVPSQSERYFDKRSPADGSLAGTVAEGGQDEVHAAVQAARTAFSGPWSRLTMAKRGKAIIILMDHAARDDTPAAATIA